MAFRHTDPKQGVEARLSSDAGGRYAVHLPAPEPCPEHGLITVEQSRAALGIQLQFALERTPCLWCTLERLRVLYGGTA